MNCILAVTQRNMNNIDKDKLKTLIESEVKEIYYKHALIEELKESKDTIILDKAIDENMTMKEIVKIFQYAKENSVLIISDKYRESDILSYFLGVGIYNVVFEEDLDTEYLLKLLDKPRTVYEAKEYYCIDEENVLEADKNCGDDTPEKMPKGIINKITSKLNWIKK